MNGPTRPVGLRSTARGAAEIRRPHPGAVPGLPIRAAEGKKWRTFTHENRGISLHCALSSPVRFFGRNGLSGGEFVSPWEPVGYAAL